MNYPEISDSSFYMFSVVSEEICPMIVLSVFISIPHAMALVAKVCLRS